jgi:hypothetical protein
MRLVILVICTCLALTMYRYNRDFQQESALPEAPKQIEVKQTKVQEANTEHTTKRSKNPSTERMVQRDKVQDTVDNKSTKIDIGEYIDVDALPSYDGRDPINIGEYIDIDAAPIDDGRPPRAIGENIRDPDELTYLNQLYQEPVNIGEYLPPTTHYEIPSEYAEPINIGEPIYVDEETGPQQY